MPGVDSPYRVTRPFAHRAESSRAPVENPNSIRGAGSREATERRLALTDPAVTVVTDFVLDQPLTVPEERSIDEALREMIRAGVRALLVVRDEVVTGLITSYDIQGERPLQFLAESGYRRHDEIEVAHIMTPWKLTPTLDWEALGRARLSELAAFFRRTAATHVVIVERTDEGRTAVRGLISRTRLERQLGHSI
jgi:CBS domain containing-hemolysin-like protein